MSTSNVFHINSVSDGTNVSNVSFKYSKVNQRDLDVMTSRYTEEYKKYRKEQKEKSEKFIDNDNLELFKKFFETIKDKREQDEKENGDVDDTQDKNFLSEEEYQQSIAEIDEQID